MKKAAYSVIIIAIVLSSPHSFAQQPSELFKPVSVEKARELEAKNNYFLAKSLYGTKRYRFVRVDTDLLESKDLILIKFFDNDSLLLDPVEIKYAMGGLVVNWIGTTVNPEWSVDDLMSQVGSQKEARRAHASIFQYSIGASRYEYEAESDTSIPSWKIEETDRTRAKSERVTLKTGQFHAVTEIFRMPGTNIVYEIQPIDFGGAYHLLKEIDPSKSFRPAADHSGGEQENVETNAKRLERQSYMNSLGEDPKTKKIEERMARKRARESR